MEYREAMQLIIAKCGGLTRLASTALMALSENSAVAHLRAQKVIHCALTDPQADFSERERTELAQLLTGEDETRTLDIRFRVTPTEKADIQERAAAEGLSVSDYIRRALGL